MVLFKQYIYRHILYVSFIIYFVFHWNFMIKEIKKKIVKVEKTTMGFIINTSQKIKTFIGLHVN